MQKHRIILIDDDLQFVNHYAKLFREYGYNVHPFVSSHDALSFIKFTDNFIDLIISNTHISGLDGLSLIKSIRCHKRFISVPFIFLSSVADESLQLEAYRSGAQDFIIKPISPQLLAAKIQSIIGMMSYSSILLRLVLMGENHTLSIEEIVAYCQSESLDGFAFVHSGKEHAEFFFNKGVMEKIQFRDFSEAAAFEHVKSWVQYQFLIVRGSYHADTIHQYLRMAANSIF